MNFSTKHLVGLTSAIKKGKKFLEIILIVLVALSFVLIPLLNQYRQKTLSLNNTHLVKRQNSRNGTIATNVFDYGDILTIHSGFFDIIDRTTDFAASISDRMISKITDGISRLFNRGRDLDE